MRFIALATFTMLLAGCADRAYIDGTVSYTATPPLDGTSGALPLRALYCSEIVNGGERVVIELGDSCALLSSNRKPLELAGACSLKMSEGEVPIDVKSITATPRFVRQGKSSVRSAFEVVLGGTTTDGHYLTYRFTAGENEEAATAEQCQALLTPPPSQW